MDWKPGDDADYIQEPSLAVFSKHLLELRNEPLVCLIKVADPPAPFH